VGLQGCAALCRECASADSALEFTDGDAVARDGEDAVGVLQANGQVGGAIGGVDDLHFTANAGAVRWA